MGEPRDFSDPKYVAWRRRVFGRDRHTCQMPGCPGVCKELNAHHIKRWAEYPRLRFVTQNGICLCASCHASILGREREYESTFQAIVAAKSSLSHLQVLFHRYAARQAARNEQ